MVRSHQRMMNRHRQLLFKIARAVGLVYLIAVNSMIEPFWAFLLVLPMFFLACFGLLALEEEMECML